MRVWWRRRRFMREHRFAHAHLSEYLDGELHGRRRARVEAHVGLCPECRRLLAGLGRTVAALMRLHPVADTGVAGSVIARLSSEP